jgi:hypothetical protein
VRYLPRRREAGLRRLFLRYVVTSSSTRRENLTSTITGINLESSFEAEILANTNHCQVWGYDFSVKSFGPEIPFNRAHRTHFSAVGLAGSDKPHDDPPMFTLESLMRKNGASHSIHTFLNYF